MCVQCITVNVLSSHFQSYSTGQIFALGWNVHETEIICNNYPDNVMYDMQKYVITEIPCFPCVHEWYAACSFHAHYLQARYFFFIYSSATQVLTITIHNSWWEHSTDKFLIISTVGQTKTVSRNICSEYEPRDDFLRIFDGIDVDYDLTYDKYGGIVLKL